MILKKKIIKSLLSIIKINLKIIIFKLLNPSSKIIFFYHPNKLLVFMHIDYIKDLLNQFGDKFLIIYGHEVDKLDEKNYFFVSHGMILNLIFNVDLFLSNNVCDKFTRNSIKIYMHHDIYDTPLVDDNNKRQLFLRLKKYNLIFLPNKKSIIMFENFFKEHNPNSNNNMPKLMEVGYAKLDYLKKDIQLFKSTNNSIVIAPTNRFEKLSMYSHIKELIHILLKNTKSKIVFRPHPSNRKSSKILEIEKIFGKNENFKLDVSYNYLNTYLNSCCLITDLSGTAYTYAFLTKKPVIFFSKNETLINELGYNKFSYFKDRKKIGIVIQELDEIRKIIENIKFLEKSVKDSNDFLEKEMNYLGNSKSRIKQLINEILNKNEDKYLHQK